MNIYRPKNYELVRERRSSSTDEVILTRRESDFDTYLAKTVILGADGWALK